MKSAELGILPQHEIVGLFERNSIISDMELDDDQIQPASIDLRLGKFAWRIRASFLPGSNSKVSDKFSDIGMHKIDLFEGAVLEKGCVYIAELQESLNLPEGISATTNPKSSTGRLDVLVRVVTENGTVFDSVPDGYSGKLYAKISPNSFPVLVRTGSRLTQIRFRRGDARVTDADLQRLHEAETLVDCKETKINGGVSVSIDLKGSDSDRIVGYRAKRHSSFIDVDKKNTYNPKDFWEPIERNEQHSLILDPEEFYILVSRESVNIPPDYAAEMVPFDHQIGEFRVHYAGFFDPGFGYSESGGKGSRAVLEVRSLVDPFILEHGQTVGRLIYERMTERPEIVYGQGIGSNYQGQTLKLSKHFKT